MNTAAITQLRGEGVLRSMAENRRKHLMTLNGWPLEEMEEEAIRQGRPVSWIAQQAWKLAREQLRRMPAPP